MKPKIYFAKTNSCSTKDVTAVRNCLSKLDAQVLEYNVSSTHREEAQKIAESDCMVVLTQDYAGDVGKGVYDQVELFLKNHVKEDVYVIVDRCGSDIYVDPLDSIETHDSSDWTLYGYLETTGGDTLLKNIPMFNSSKSPSKDSKMEKILPGRVWKDGTQFTIGNDKEVYTIRKNTNGSGSYVHWGRTDKVHYDDSTLDQCFGAKDSKWKILNVSNPFKVGDVVKFVKSKCKSSFYTKATTFTSSLKDGRTYIVSDVESNSTDIKEWQNNFIRLKDETYAHAFDCFELVTETVETKVKTEKKVEEPIVRFRKGDKVRYKYNPDTFYKDTKEYAKKDKLVEGGVYEVIKVHDTEQGQYIVIKAFSLAADCFEPVVTTKNEPVKREDVDKVLRLLDADEEKTATRKSVYDVETMNPCGEIWLSQYSYTPPTPVTSVKVEVTLGNPTSDNMMMLLIG